MNLRVWGVVTGCMLLMGCGGSADSVEYEADYEEDDVPEETVFDPMVGTMDRAAGVEDMNMDRKDEMDKAIDGD